MIKYCTRMTIELYPFFASTILFYGIRFQILQRKNQSIDILDNNILFTNHLMMISVIIGGWVMQISYFPLLSLQSYFSLRVSLYRKRPYKRSEMTPLKFIPAIIFSYLLLKIYTQKSYNYGKGQIINGLLYQGVSNSLDGWNCTYPEYWIVCFILFVQQLSSIYFGLEIMKQENDINHSWKQCFLLQKTIPTLLCLAIMIIFFIYSWSQAKSPIQCLNYWQSNYIWKQVCIQIVKTVIYSGSSGIVIRFYYVITPYFKLDNTIVYDPRLTRSSEGNQRLLQN